MSERRTALSGLRAFVRVVNEVRLSMSARSFILEMRADCLRS